MLEAGDVDIPTELTFRVVDSHEVVQGTHIRRTDESFHTGFTVEHMVHLIHGVAALPHEVKHHGGVDIATAATHDQTAQRGKPHRGVNRLAVLHCGNRGPVTQVHDDLPQITGIEVEEFGNLLGDILVTRAMSSVTANRIGVSNILRNGEDGGCCGEVSKERGIKYGHVGDTGEQLAGNFHTQHVGRIVERCQRGETLNLVHHRVVNFYRLAEKVATLHNAVANSYDILLIKVESDFREEVDNELQTDAVVGDCGGVFDLFSVVLDGVFAFLKADLVDEAGRDDGICTFQSRVDELVLDGGRTRVNDEYSAQVGLLNALSLGSSDRDGVDDVLHEGAAGEVIDGFLETLQDGSDGDSTGSTLHCLIGVVAGVEVGEDQYGGASGDN